MKMPRIRLCMVVALLGFFLSPYVTNLLPGGGEVEQQWLDREMKFIERKLETCDDPEMVIAFEQALKYRRVGRFGVRVMQLPEGVHGYNMPTCPGMTIDEEVLRMGLHYGAFVIIHEAMHDLFPCFGHYHIDNEQILEALYENN